MSIGKAAQIQGSEYWNGRCYADGVPPKQRKREKQRKTRHERRKARQNPETIPSYGRYAGWWW